jgi:hypothetical protein
VVEAVEERMTNSTVFAASTGLEGQQLGVPMERLERGQHVS